MTVKSPEEYFSQQVYSVKQDDEKSFTVAERAFIQKYLGVDEADVFTEIGLEPIEPEVTLSFAPQQPAPVKLTEAQVIAEKPAEPQVASLPKAIVTEPQVATLVVPDPIAKPQPILVEPKTAPEPAVCQPCPVTPTPEAIASEEMDKVSKAFLDSNAAAPVIEPAPAAPKPAYIEPKPTPTAPKPVAPVAVSIPAPAAQEMGEASKVFLEPNAVAAQSGTKTNAARPSSSSTNAPAIDFDPFFGIALEEPRLEDEMRLASEIQLVGFFVNKQEFAVPIIAVQEVIRQMPLTKLPAAPSLISGVINLRGRVTPLLNLREFLDIEAAAKQEHSFIVICRRRGLQIGLIIDRVHTMYRVSQKDIDWAVETHLGNADSVCGLLKSGDRLIGIISVDKIIDSILEDLEGL